MAHLLTAVGNQNRTLTEDVVPEGEKHGVGEYIKIVLIGGKVIYFLYFLTKAQIAYKAKNGGNLLTREGVIFGLYMFLMAMIPVFDFLMPHKIIILFLMVLFSNFGVFLCQWNLAECIDGGSPSEIMLSRFKPVKIIIPILYAVLLVLSFIPATGAHCTLAMTYPPLFMVVFSLNLLVTLITIRFYRHGFWRVDYLPLASKDHFDEVGIQSNMNETLLTTGVNKDHQRIHCYEEQTKYFTLISTIAAVFQLVLGLVGLLALEDSGVIGCNMNDPSSEHSGNWVFLRGGATVFVTMHILAMIIQTAAINASLYKVPLKFGVLEKQAE
ncbi:hypothetical protein FGO68_gene9420 [Halteria grandinella]|uniref:Uncharacterized protein n=1 Tax=Halteria grandinella TaxID=5974 RepID=A0A8J8SWB7_HALGN|nr:hypothetical protein FGO68_gene9420 [Halteria grandinella]